MTKQTFYFLADGEELTILDATTERGAQEEAAKRFHGVRGAIYRMYEPYGEVKAA